MAENEGAKKPVKRVQKLTLKKGVSFEDVIRVAVTPKKKTKAKK